MSSFLQQDAIPSALSHIVMKMSNFKSTRTKLTPEASTSVSANGNLTIRFPSASIVDFSSFMLHGLYDATGATPHADHLETHINRITLSVGGQVITTVPSFNDVYKILCNATSSTQHQAQKNVMNNGGLGAIKIAKQNVTATAAVTTVATELAAQNEIPSVAQVATGNIITADFYRDLATWDGNGTATESNCVASWWAGIEDLGYVDMSLLSGVELEIQFAGNNVMAGDADNSWTLSAVYGSVNVISYPTWQQSLYTVLAGNPETGQGGELIWSFRKYTPYVFNKAGGNESLKFSLSSSCLNRVWYSQKNNAYNTLGPHVGTALNYFRYSDYTTIHTAQIADLQLTIDNTPFPNYPLQNKYGFANALASLGKQGDTQWDSVIDSTSDFRANKYFQCFNFQFLDGEHDSLMSGINTQGLSANMTLDLTSTCAANGVHLVICEHQSVMRVQGGRIVSIEN